MVEATNTPSYDVLKNFEVLEVLGDSILKYLTTVFLIINTKNVEYDEEFLDEMRVKFIKNKLFTVISFKNLVHYYI